MARQHSDTAHRHRRSRPTHPTGPLVVDVTRLGRRPGSMVPLRDTVPSPSRIGAELIAIEPGAPLELDLRVESVSEGVLVTGTVSAPTVGECGRCLTPVPGRVEAGVVETAELFVTRDRRLVRADGFPPHAERFSRAGVDLGALLRGRD